MKPEAFVLPEGWARPSEDVINSLKGKGVTFQSFRFPQNVEGLFVVLHNGEPQLKESIVHVNDKHHSFISFLFVYKKGDEVFPISVPFGVLRPKLDVAPSEVNGAVPEVIDAWESSITSEIVREMDDFDGAQRFLALCAEQIKKTKLSKRGLAYLPIEARMLTGLYRKIESKKAIRNQDGSLALFPKQVYAIKFA